MQTRTVSKLLPCLLIAALATACAPQPEVHYSGDASRPQLATLASDPEVRVVVNSDEPIFFTSYTFWLYRNDTWWQSSSHRTGWVRANLPPERVTRISQPSRYVHYQPTTTGAL